MAKIINFSEAASIAIHGMILISNSEENLNVLKIAERLEASKHHVAKVMQRLVKIEFIASKRGPTGGFQMIVAPDEITFLDIYEAIEGKLKVTSCPFEKGAEICSFNRCIMDNVTAQMTQHFKKYMASQTIEMYKGNVKPLKESQKKSKI